MKVLVVGGGGREHAICWKLAQSPKITGLWCAPGNGGIAKIAQCVEIAATDVDSMVAWATENSMDFVVVAPDDPLALGMVDAMETAGIPAFGPTANAAVIEASKSFAKDLMDRYNIPTARCRIFDQMDQALEYVRDQKMPIVIKADGLALGKGVIICQSVEQAEEAIRSMMGEKKFGNAGNRIVIEECMTGPEVTILAFCDGEHLACMPSTQDHKRAFDGNQGPNTGGMGAFSPSPNYTPDVADECMQRIFLPTIAALQSEGRLFQGVLYFGLMLTQNGPKVVEYNARFGDPECQVVLSLLESDLLGIMLACRNGTLDQEDIRWRQEAACCLVLASGGYPVSYKKGYEISGLARAGESSVVFHAGTSQDENGHILTNGGRVLGVTATGPTLENAIDAAYSAAANIQFQDMFFRHDIGRV